MSLIWTRRSADSNRNFDLVLQNPEDLEPVRMHGLLDSIVQERHRGQTLNRRAITEFRRFFDQPGTPLRSAAYVLLSNWFLTRSGDRHSVVAFRCEALWDELFPCRPLERLSSPAAGKNHILLVSEFQSFWFRASKAQAESGAPVELGGVPSSPTGILPEDAPRHVARLVTGSAPESGGVMKSDDRVRATFVKDGLEFQVEGTPGAMADFLDRWTEGDRRGPGKQGTQ